MVCTHSGGLLTFCFACGQSRDAVLQATIGRKRFRGVLVEESKLEELATASASPTPDLTFMSLLQRLAPQPFQFPIAECVVLLCACVSPDSYR